MSLDKMIGKAVIIAALAGGACATTRSVCTFDNTTRYTIEDENAKVSYYEGGWVESPFGLFNVEPDSCVVTLTDKKTQYWFALKDIGCDGTVEAYLGVSEKGETSAALRTGNEAEFEKNMDPIFNDLKKQAKGGK